MDFVIDQPPADDEIEVSLFGPGTGEAVAVHLGNGAWGLVDSCRHPASRAPATLEYLNAIGVDTERVDFVFASHWHDDHVQGLAELLAACPNAQFGCSQAYTGPEFEAIVLAYDRIKAAPIQELGACLELIERKAPMGAVRHTHTRIAERATLWSTPDRSVQVRALAPTPQAIARSEHAVATQLLPRAKKRLSFGQMTPNHGSIVLVIETPGDSVLLGGDLEEGGSGWSAVVARRLGGDRKSSLFKVPHHGSSGAHLDAQWTVLIEPEPISICTTYAASRLPRQADRSRILSHSRDFYLAGQGHEDRPAVSKIEQHAMARDGVVLQPGRRFGHIRLRQRLDEHAAWNVAISAGAVRVTEDTIMRSSPAAGSTRRRGRRSGSRGRDK